MSSEPCASRAKDERTGDYTARAQEAKKAQGAIDLANGGNNSQGRNKVFRQYPQGDDGQRVSTQKLADMITCYDIRESAA